ncbi:MAG: tripartite tricarboxylate transporter substrate-binding protein, partial [Burkholderiales bacterium]
YTVNPSLYKIKFHPVDDITAVVQISQGPYLVVVNPSLPARNMGELIALARSRPEMINFASSGTGSLVHQL